MQITHDDVLLGSVLPLNRPIDLLGLTPNPRQVETSLFRRRIRLMKLWFQNRCAALTIQRSHLALGLSLLWVITSVYACTGLYFQSAGVKPPEPHPITLSELGFTEYWTGIVFNGERIGFTHFKISRHDNDQNRFDIVSEAYFHIRFLMYDKRINLVGYDTVTDDLTLLEFRYDYDLDGNHLTIRGQRTDDSLITITTSKGQRHTKSIPFDLPLYPTSAINLYPYLQGLEIGRQFKYWVFDGQTKTISKIEQKILAYEKSELFHGPAFRLKTRLHGHEATTWLDQSGKPLFELSLGGVIISALEDKKRAERYLTHAAINKHEPFLDYSLIKTQKPLSNPRHTQSLTLMIYGDLGEFIPPSDGRQHCFRKGDKLHCLVSSHSVNSYSIAPQDKEMSVARFLAPSYAIPSRNPDIQQLATNITSQTDADTLKIRKIMDWIDTHIAKKPVDVFTALDVLETRQAECQGHAYLFAAICRAVGIPTRIANGIVYSKQHQGFLYHTWAECWLKDVWVAIDPIFMQLPADATHVKFVEGESISNLLPLIGIIGKIDVQIIQAMETKPEAPD